MLLSHGAQGSRTIPAQRLCRASMGRHWYSAAHPHCSKPLPFVGPDPILARLIPFLYFTCHEGGHGALTLVPAPRRTAPLCA